jgi:hypothetical protein
MGITITQQEAFGLITKTVQETVKVTPPASSFFRQFFKNDETAAYGTKFEIVRRGRGTLEDVSLESTESTIHKLGKSSEQLYVPPCYRESVGMSAFDAYYRQVGESDIVSNTLVIDTTKQIKEELTDLLSYYDRTEELQCANAMLTGQVPLVTGDTLNYNRRAASIIAYNAAYDFAIDTVDPSVAFLLMANQLVGYGMINPSTPIIVLMAEDVLSAFQKNPIVQKRADIKNYELMNLKTGVNALGSVTQGYVSYGSYTFELRTYPALYDTKSATNLNYMPAKKMLMFPSVMDNKMFYGGTPKWLTSPYGDNPAVGVMKGMRSTQVFTNPRAFSVEYMIQSRFLAIPRQIDQCVTLTVLQENPPA